MPAEIIPFGNLKDKKADLVELTLEGKQTAIGELLDLASEIENGNVHEFTIQIVNTNGKVETICYASKFPGRLLIGLNITR